MAKKGKNKVNNARNDKEGIHFTTPQFIAFVLMIVILVPLFFRIFNSPSPASLNEINSITSILEVLVAVLAIMGFELFIWIYESLRKVDKFDERIDKIEDKIESEVQGIGSRIGELGLLLHSVNLRIFSNAMQAMGIESLIDFYLSDLLGTVKDKDYRDGMAVLFSKAAEIVKNTEKLFYVYFDDEKMKIDDKRLEAVFAAIDYFLLTADEDSADTFCEIFNLRLREARNRMKTWESLLGSVTYRLKGCVNFSFECEELKKRKDYLQKKIEKENEIFKKVYASITELGRTPDIDSVT